MSAMNARNAMHMRDLFRLGRQTASGVVPDEARESLPIPLRHGGDPLVVFLFVPQVRQADAPNLLRAPNYRATLRAADGRLQALDALGAYDGPPGANPADEAGNIGSYGLPEGLTPVEFAARRDDLFAAYDVLLPLFAQGETVLGANGRDWARHFVQLFELLSEPPLRPYYTQYGGEFFQWVAGVAGA